ncbi:hypothetical protein HanXRQr2_Chr13g0601821 [Helianthus annuus]|uniref:Uncharacterized protein n=1 Tax=Helianthus annuus TaxID=4232 RepID=A0A9K3EK10_HELAN|nr:hypothetical protein HanXRQr2_Chr13g0601821 [Helianthus annuus]
MLMRSSSSNVIVFPSETLDVLIGLSPLSIFDSFACLLAAEKDVPQMSDPPDIKLITCAFAGGAGAFSGILSGSWVLCFFLPSNSFRCPLLSRYPISFLKVMQSSVRCPKSSWYAHHFNLSLVPDGLSFFLGHLAFSPRFCIARINS